MNQQVFRWVVGWMAFLTMAGIDFSQYGPPSVMAEGLHSRIRLDYQSMSRLGLNSSFLLQEYNFTVEDELFVKNMLTVNLRWNRLNDFKSHDSVGNYRLRLGLRGVAYDMSILYTPAHYSSLSQQISGQKSDNFLATWQYRPAGHPQMRFEYRQSKSTSPVEDLQKVTTASRQRLFQLDHNIGPIKLGGSYRVRNGSGSFASSDREIRSGLLRADIHKQYGRKFKTDLAVDYQRTDTDHYDRTDLIRTANMRFGAFWYANPKLMASLGGYLRDIVSEQSTNSHSVNNSRELSARCVYRPASAMQFEMRRDMRRNRNLDNTIYSDLLRLQASFNGNLRKGLKGRLNLVKNVTVRTENVATPSDVMDFTMDFKLYRRTTVRTSYIMSRYQHKAADFRARYSTLATFELRSRLTRRMVTNITYRTTGVSSDLTFLQADIHNVSAGLNYTSPRGLTFSGTLRQTYLANSSIAPQTSLNTNLSLVLHRNVTWTVDGAWNEAGTVWGKSSNRTFNSRLQLRLGQTTVAVLGYMENHPSNGFRSKSVTGSLTANF